MAVKFFLYFVVTLLAISSVPKTDSKGIAGQLSTIFSNIINQKLSALNSLNMHVANNQSTAQTQRPSVTIILSPNTPTSTHNTTSQSQSPAVAESNSANASKPATGGAPNGSAGQSPAGGAMPMDGNTPSMGAGSAPPPAQENAPAGGAEGAAEPQTSEEAGIMK